MRSVVITGMGVVAPGAIGTAALWDRVCQGPPAGMPISRFDVSRYQCQIAAEVSDFHAGDYGLTREQCTVLDRWTKFALAAARMAVEDARLLTDRPDPERIGVCIGTAIGGVEIMDYGFARAFVPPPCEDRPDLDSLRRSAVLPASMFRAFMPHTAATEVAATYHLGGPCTTVSTGCTAGADAIGHALRAVRRGDCELMIVGGADAPITPVSLAAFDIIHAITRRNDAPSLASRPFDAERDGFLLAEGAGVLVLEERSHALARGARVYAEVLGFGTTCNAYHMTGLPEDGSQLARAMCQAVRDADIPIDCIDHVNAHGSSTPQNDVNETNAIKSAFGERARHIPVSGTKSAIGHPLGAAAALECIVTAMSLVHQFVPPTLNYQTPDPRCDLDYVPNRGRSSRIRAAISNASGFSGLHSSLVLAEG